MMKKMPLITCPCVLNFNHSREVSRVMLRNVKY